MPKDTRLKKIVDHIRLSLRNLQVNFFHMVRKHNTTADEMANLEIGKAQGFMWVGGMESLIPLVMSKPPKSKPLLDNLRTNL
jgi:hypothetical protein